MRVRVEVTAEDIAAGVRSDACECPIALAVRRACKVSWARVACAARDDDHAAVSFGDTKSIFGQEYPAPEEVLEFFNDFDRGRPVSPFAFDLDVPDELTP